jgi:hypothetical protein
MILPPGTVADKGVSERRDNTRSVLPISNVNSDKIEYNFLSFQRGF